MSNLCNYLLIRVNLEPIKSEMWLWSQIKLSSNQVLMAEMHYHKLSPNICDYEQLISIGYKCNQFEINDVL